MPRAPFDANDVKSTRDKLCSGNPSRLHDPHLSVEKQGMPFARRSSNKKPASLKLRIDFDSEGRLGPGKIRLLELIDVTGSISAAGRVMNMSYRHAWGLLEEIRRTFKRAAVIGHAGGAKNGGAELTPFGHALITRYRTIEQKVDDAVGNELQALKAEIGLVA